MYQYFPHKQALFSALNERYLDMLAQKVEGACRAQQGASLDRMVEALLTTYWNAKTEQPEVTRALYRSVVELDNESLIEAFARRVDAATAAMFSSASDAVLDQLPTVNLTLLTTILRSVFERNLPGLEASAVQGQLILMCNAYLAAVKSGFADRARGNGTRGRAS